MILLVESVWILPSLRSQRPDRGDGRPAGEIDAEFFLERLAELIAFEFVEQLLECRTEADLIDRKTARRRNCGIIGIDRRQCGRTDETGHDQVFERLLHQRRRPERLEP